MLGHTETKSYFGWVRVFVGLKRRAGIGLAFFGVACCVLCNVLMNDGSVFAESTISLTLDANAIVLDLFPHKANGTFAESDDLNVNVTVSGPGGYTLGIQSSGSTNLVNQVDNTKILTSISGIVSAADFAVDSASAGSTYNDKWGYLPSMFDSASNEVFRPAPDSSGDVLDVTRVNNAEDDYTISIGARANMSTTPGSYVNTFTITAVSNYSCSVGEVCYYDNGGDGEIMDDQIIPSGDTEIQLVGSKYYRTGYGFAGWSPTMLDPDDANFASDFAAATVYGPNETVEIPVSGYLPLYAVWVPSEGNMQAWNECSSLNIGDVIGLTDTRDGNVYAVAKLADSKCWMIENFRLDFSDEDTEITNLNTNHPTARFMSDADRHPEQSDSRYSRNAEIRYTTSYLPSNYSNGIYYSYYTFRGGNGNIGTKKDDSGDICPAGWRIPTSYSGLVSSLMGSSLNPFTNTTEPTAESVKKTLTSYPNNFVKSGYFYNGNPSEQFFYVNVNYGYSSTYYLAYGMFASGTSFYSNWSWTSEPNDNGWVFRCVEGDIDSYTLNYDANGGSNAPVSEVINSSSGLFENISSSVPIRNGYTFMGWVDEDGVEVQPGEGYNAGIGNTNMTLYAMWTNDSCNENATTIGTGNSTDAVCMQDMNGAVRNAMHEANVAAGSIQSFQLIDARDNQSYDIAFLDDENVWMTKNLNIGNNNTILLNHYESDISDIQVHLLKADYPYNNYYAGDTDDGYYDGVYYGGYYEWRAAAVYDQSFTSSTNINDSICPYGWSLPTRVHYSNLISVASLTDFTSATASPYSFTGGGYMSTSYSTANGLVHGYTNRGSYGYYWTSSGSTSSSMATDYYFNSSSSQLSTIGESKGLNVRCIVKNGTVTINYDGNGDVVFPVTGSMSSQVVDNNTGNVKNNSFQRDAYSFRIWNTEPDGSGLDVAGGSDVYLLNLSDGDEITLYAQWTPLAVITYNDNYTAATSIVSVRPGYSTTLYSSNFFTTKSGYSIKEWNTEPDGSGTTYAVSSSYSAPSNLSEPLLLTLYAQWVKDCEITFVNTITGETQTKSLKWNQSGNLTTSTTWTYNGYKIVGWDIVSNGGLGGNGTVVYNVDQSITLTSDLTIYTVWAAYYTIQYDGNGASSDTSMSITHDITEAGDITLYASNYKRSGYGFAGWSFDPNAASNMNSTTIYGPNATLAVSAVTTPGEIKTLYAVWVEAENGVTMQTFDDTAQPYASDAIGTVRALTDSRDNDTYAVAKLADDKWWMIENLRLGASSSTNLTNSDTAITSASSTLPGSATSISTSAYSISMNASNKLSPSNPMSTIDSNVITYGNYYSWAAAIMSTSSYSSTTVTTSVCPYGWHLPSGNTNGEFANLSDSLDGLTSVMNANTSPTGAEFSKTMRAFPNNFNYSGYWYYRNSSSRGTNGIYWSSTSSGSNMAYYLSINNTTVSPAISARYRYYASSIRCIAD